MYRQYTDNVVGQIKTYECCWFRVKICGALGERRLTGMYGVQRFSITDWLYDAHERNKLYRVDGWNRYAELKPREKKERK